MSWSYKSIDFCSEPMENKPVSALPGVGPVTEGKLNARGYYKATDVYKLLQRMNFDEDTFCSWIKQNFRGCRAAECYNALMRWHHQFGDTNTRLNIAETQRPQRTQRLSVPSTSNSNNCDQGNRTLNVVQVNVNPEPRATVSTPRLRSFSDWIFANEMAQTPSTSDQPPQRQMTFEEYMLGPLNSVDILRNTGLRTSEQLNQNPRTNCARLAQTPRAPEQIVQNPRVSEQLAQIPRSLQQSVQSTREAQQPLRAPEQAVQPSRSNEQTEQHSRTNEQIAQPQRTNEQAVQPQRAPAQPSQTPATSEQSGQNPRTSLQSGQNSRTSPQRGLTNASSKDVVELDPLCTFFFAMEATVKKVQLSSSRVPATTASRQDSVEAFFETMEATVRTFQPESVLDVKSQIFKIINDYERSCLQKLAEPAPSTSQRRITQN